MDIIAATLPIVEFVYPKDIQSLKKAISILEELLELASKQVEELENFNK